MTTYWVRATDSTGAIEAPTRSQSGITGLSGTDDVSLAFDDRAAELMVDPSLAASALARAPPPPLAPIHEAAPAGAAAAPGAAAAAAPPLAGRSEPSQQLTGSF